VNLNDEQVSACEAMIDFLSPASKERFFVLSGPAGTGKTYTIRALMNRIKSKLIFTAPTNKATKVLRDTFIEHKLEGGYTPTCRTIYSLLGLRMEPDGEVKKLAYPEDPVDLSKFAAVVVDEGSMINSKLWKYIRELAEEQNVKFLFLGDMYQLPPVGEPNSPIWTLPNIKYLKTVMRHDNQILTLATSIREVMDHPIPSLSIESDWKDGEGVRKVGTADFLTLIKRAAEEGLFSGMSGCKAIAWRNVSVDSLNRLIRQTIFPGTVGDFFPEDRIILLEPVKSFINNEVVATTDEEGTVERTDVDYHPEYPEMKCFRIVAQMDGRHPLTFWKLHPEAERAFSLKLAELAARAKTSGRFWKDYWNFKDAFHNLRYSYAITAHRAQGSTYTQTFVNMTDIMMNRNRLEAFRCLYVAVTRAKKRVIIT
jgi:ATP-dependent exoDNAse (exonuclease V) alpha subunit